MKYVFAFAAVLLAALFCWWIAQPAPIATLHAPPHGPIAAATGANTAAAVPAAPDRVAASEVIAPPSDGTASLRVHATSAISGRPLANLAIRIWPGPEKRSVDGTARIQTISRDQNQPYYDLLRAFEARTGVPVLVNTSFNTRGEPIVCSPRDAIESFWTSPLDALVIGSFLLLKPSRLG